jgi:16S rRNA (cytosine1402-N4)-methyltransferase
LTTDPTVVGAGHHAPVLREEVVGALRPEVGQVMVDCTFGRGGHTRALLACLGATGRVVALDRDPDAVQVAREMADDRLCVVHAPFSELAAVLGERHLLGKVDGVLLDLGVSSPQLDEAHRGFSFRVDGPLDMRMDPSRGQSAAEWLATVDEAELMQVLRTLGEERFARRIARAVVRHRAVEPLTRTAQLAKLVSAACPFKERSKHPATRTFQAIRMSVNGELDELDAGLSGSLEALSPGGRLAVISFHSLEDRKVKHFMRAQHKGPELPRGLPPPPDMPLPPLGRVHRPIRAGEVEVLGNPRARSAVLRIAEMRP